MDTDRNGQDVGDPENLAAYAPMTPHRLDPTEMPSLEDAYPRGHRAARTLLETIGIPGEPGGFATGFDGERAERLVSLILGAALLELERPWREALERADAEASRYWRERNDVRRELEQIAAERDRARITTNDLSARWLAAQQDADRRAELIDDAHLRLRELPSDLRGDEHGDARDPADVADVIDLILSDLAQELDR